MEKKHIERMTIRTIENEEEKKNWKTSFVLSSFFFFSFNNNELLPWQHLSCRHVINALRLKGKEKEKEEKKQNDLRITIHLIRKMDSDDQYENTRQYSTLSMGQTVTAPLNNTSDFFVIISREFQSTILLLLIL